MVMLIDVSDALILLHSHLMPYPLSKCGRWNRRLRVACINSGCAAAALRLSHPFAISARPPQAALRWITWFHMRHRLDASTLHSRDKMKVAVTRSSATAERQRVSYARHSRLAQWSCTSLNAAPVVQLYKMATHLQISERWCCIIWIITKFSSSTQVRRPLCSKLGKIRTNVML